VTYVCQGTKMEQNISGDFTGNGGGTFFESILIILNG
jgi:hypothetical protein